MKFVIEWSNMYSMKTTVEKIQFARIPHKHILNIGNIDDWISPSTFAGDLSLRRIS